MNLNSLTSAVPPNVQCVVNPLLQTKIGNIKIDFSRVKFPQTPEQWKSFGNKIKKDLKKMGKDISVDDAIRMAQGVASKIKKSGIPKTAIPKTGIPKTTIPKTTIPKTTIPKTAIPKTTMPKTGIPKTTKPKTAMPKIPPKPAGVIREFPESVENTEKEVSAFIDKAGKNNIYWLFILVLILILSKKKQKKRSKI